MGGGGSKQAQLERYGQLLTPGEREALEITFLEISGSQEASFFTEKQLTVSTIPYMQLDVYNRWAYDTSAGVHDRSPVPSCGQ